MNMKVGKIFSALHQLLSLCKKLYEQSIYPSFLIVYPYYTVEIQKCEYYNLLVNIQSLYSSRSQVIALECTANQDTRSCVSGQESRVTHKCVIYRNR